MESTNSRRTLRRAQVQKKTGLGRTTVYRLEKDPSSGFPQHFLLTPRCAVWYEDEIDAWVEARRKAPAPIDTAMHNLVRRGTAA